MTKNKYGKGCQIDPVTGCVIGRSMMYGLSVLGDVTPIGLFNPLHVKRVTNDALVASISGPIMTNTSTAIKIADANVTRRFFSVCTSGDNKAVWIKLQPASIDDDKKGIWIEAKVGAINYWEMPPDNIYIGEISAIANSADVNVYVTEY